ncbi:hypothetical protein [Propionivibrio soli]|nr:hypothetical protein [Propionivibrio soli]
MLCHISAQELKSEEVNSKAVAEVLRTALLALCRRRKKLPHPAQ